MMTIMRFTALTAASLVAAAGIAIASQWGESFSIKPEYRGKYDRYFNSFYTDKLPYEFGQLAPKKRRVSDGSVWDTDSIIAGRYTPDNGKKIPDKVYLFWLNAPLNSKFGETDQATLASLPKFKVLDTYAPEMNNPSPEAPKAYGPYEFEIRSMIPWRVLWMSRSYDYSIGITIEYAETYRKVYWALKDERLKRQPNSDNTKVLICAGGELDLQPNDKVLHIKGLQPSDYDGTKQTSVPVWPHCEL